MSVWEYAGWKPWILEITDSTLLNVTSIMVSVIAITFSVVFAIISVMQERSASRTLTRAEGTLDIVREFSNRIDTQISGNFKSTLDTIQRILMASTLNDRDRILQRCFPLSKVSEFEGNAKHEIYIHAATLDYEVHSFINVVALNLHKGVKYVYFMPDTDFPDNDVRRFLTNLLLAGITPNILRTQLEIIKVSSAELSCNVVIYDPYDGDKEAYILPVFSEPEDAFLVRLDDRLHDKMMGTSQRWYSRPDKIVSFPSETYESLLAQYNKAT